MRDMVTNGTGNSRYLKSALASGTSWADALAMLRAGTFPVDFAGLNNAGITQQGSAYSKANVLPQAVCQALGLTENTAEPKDAFTSLSGSAFADIVTYTGTGTCGQSNPTTITFSVKPKLVVIWVKVDEQVSSNTTVETYSYYPTEFPFLSPYYFTESGHEYFIQGQYSSNHFAGTYVKRNGYTLSIWASATDGPGYQYNVQGYQYYALAIGERV